MSRHPEHDSVPNPFVCASGERDAMRSNLDGVFFLQFSDSVQPWSSVCDRTLTTVLPERNQDQSHFHSTENHVKLTRHDVEATEMTEFICLGGLVLLWLTNLGRDCSVGAQIFHRLGKKFPFYRAIPLYFRKSQNFTFDIRQLQRTSEVSMASNLLNQRSSIL